MSKTSFSFLNWCDKTADFVETESGAKYFYAKLPKSEVPNVDLEHFPSDFCLALCRSTDSPHYNDGWQLFDGWTTPEEQAEALESFLEEVEES